MRLRRTTRSRSSGATSRRRRSVSDCFSPRASRRRRPRRAREAIDAAFKHLKLKVGADLEDDLRRARLVRAAIGDDNRLSLDANQAWGVEQAIAAIGRLSEVDPFWIEEPTSPDDVLG